MELLKPWDLPVLIFHGKAKLTLGGCRRGLPRKKYNSREQKEGGRYILNRAGEFKMEIPA
jgi:hypothetical protein